MRATVENVHQRHGQDLGVDPAKVAIEWQAGGDRGGLGGGETDAKNGVGPVISFILGAIGGDQGGVERSLIGGVEPDGDFRKRAVHIGHGLRDPFAQVTLLVAVAKLDRLVGACAGSRRDGGPTEGAIGQRDVDFDRGIAAAVEDLATAHGGDRCGMRAHRCVQIPD